MARRITELLALLCIPFTAVAMTLSPSTRESVMALAQEEQHTNSAHPKKKHKHVNASDALVDADDKFAHISDYRPREYGFYKDAMEGVVPPSDSPYLMPEYQCGSEYSNRTLGCKTCTMNRTCACDGIVKFGYGESWSNWTNVSGEIDCSKTGFGQDPLVGRGKVCMCRPKVHMCATEWSRPWANCTECGSYKTTCQCNGNTRMGYEDTWGNWTNSTGEKRCRNENYGGDIDVGQGKICQCQPFDLTANMPGDNVPTLGEDLGAVLKSILTVSLTYFMVYVVLAGIRTKNQFWRNLPGPSSVEKIFESASASCVYFAPMLCAIFFAVSKRANTLSDGSPLYYGLPPLWLCYACGTCSICFVGQTFCYIMAETSALQGAIMIANNENRQVLVQTTTQLRTINFWRMVCNVFLFVMYSALAVVIAGTLLMREPEQVLKEKGWLPPRSCTTCTLVLAIVYFGIYFALHVFRSREFANRNEHGAPGAKPPFGFEVLKLAATAMNFAPMLSLLFMGTQIAADWAEIFVPSHCSKWMFICMFSVLGQTLLIIAAPIIAKAELQVVGSEGEVDFVTMHHDWFVIIGIIRWLAMFLLYVGILVVVSSAWDAGFTPGLTHQMYRFSFLYFGAYFILWTVVTARQFTEGGYARAIRIFSVAKDTVQFCPMLVALYMAAYVRAHHFTNIYENHGVPQSWVQDCMSWSFASLTMMLLMVIMAGLSTQPLSDDPQKRSPARTYLIGYTISLFVFFGTVAGVVWGIAYCNPSNADVAGAWFA